MLQGLLQADVAFRETRIESGCKKYRCMTLIKHPDTSKPSVEPSGLVLERFGLARLDFGLAEPQNPNQQGSEVEKYKVEHLNFTKHQKLLPNSS